jgi:hypothetical protein
MAVNPRIEWFCRDLMSEYCHGLDSSVVNTVAHLFC